MRYTDDTFLTSDSFNKIIVKSKKIGLTLNAKKTYCMMVSKNQDYPVWNLKANGEDIIHVDKFIYLGNIVTSKCVSEMDIILRIVITKMHSSRKEGFSLALAFCEWYIVAFDKFRFIDAKHGQSQNNWEMHRGSENKVSI